jgi:hypothetical protein
MKHIIIVLSIILFVLLTFFTPTLIESVDASFSRYDYLHDFRRTSQARDDDHPNDGWQKDGTFNPIHVIQETRPDGSTRILENDSRYSSIVENERGRVDRIKNERVENERVANERVANERDRHRDKNVEKKSDKSHSDKSDSDKSDSKTNLLPYLLIILVLLFIVIVAVKYTGSNKSLMNRGNTTTTTNA